MAALTLQDVRRSFGTSKVQHVLKDIHLVVEDGEFIILVGPSGCGKSTLLNIIAGLDAPTAGRVLIGGRDVTEVPSKDRDIAMVFQSYALYPNMTVAQNIAFGLEIRKVPKPQREAAVQRVAQMLQIGHLLDRKPAALSGGQRQRVAMGRALARDPKLFLFDEPLSNLDAKLRVEMRAEIKRLHQRTRTTTVYVTHDQVEAMTLGDRIAVMNGGVIEQLGTPGDIYGRPATRFVAEFIGSPAMNMLNTRRSAAGLQAAGATDRSADGAAKDAGSGVDLPVNAALWQALANDGNRSDFVYGLRPEDVSLVPDGFLPGSLVMLEPTGPETYAMVETAAGVLTARLPGQLPLKMGDPVRLDWKAERAHLFDARSGARVA